MKEKNSCRVEGLILQASYSTAHISYSGMRVMSIYGSKDGVQQGEGKADITSEQQQTDTAQAVAEFCLTANGDE